jgi:CHAD domain-containing protein
MEVFPVDPAKIKPVLSGYIREAESLLMKDPIPSDKSVHDIRVLMKKSRATLKLAASQLDITDYKACNTALREVGRIMRDWREASVSRRTLNKFRNKYPELFERLDSNEPIIAILDRDSMPVADLTGEKIGEIAVLLKNAGYRIRFRSWDKMAPELIVKELDSSFSKAENIFLLSRNNIKPESIHEFRKITKDLLYQLRFFRDVNPSVVKYFSKKLDRIAWYLGKYNDLTQLIKDLSYKSPGLMSDRNMDELVVRIRDRQDDYLSHVWPDAFRIFFKRPFILQV